MKHTAVDITGAWKQAHRKGLTIEKKVGKLSRQWEITLPTGSKVQLNSLRSLCQFIDNYGE